MEPVRRPAGTAPLAIELGQDASVSLHVFGETPASTFGPDQIAALFEVGLATAEEDENMLVPVGELELADVRFLVGAVELDPAVGMAAVERGLREAIRRWLRHRADSPQEPEPGPPAAGPVVADTATVETAVDTDKAGASEYVGPAVPPDGPEPTVVMISTEQWLESPLELVDRVVGTGEHLVVTREGEPVAVLVPFEYYRATRERLAKLDSAYWAAWKGGTWQPDPYVSAVLQVVLVDDEVRGASSD